ncbi:retrovirus-related pol polyprotein from transposon TNT 1-94 [Tanacetum coccineum]
METPPPRQGKRPLKLACSKFDLFGAQALSTLFQKHFRLLEPTYFRLDSSLESRGNRRLHFMIQKDILEQTGAPPSLLGPQLHCFLVLAFTCLSPALLHSSNDPCQLRVRSNSPCSILSPSGSNHRVSVAGAVAASRATTYGSLGSLLCGSYDHDTNNMIISLEREINPRNPQHAFKRCEAYGSSTHTTTDPMILNGSKEEHISELGPVGCSRHMTGVKIYLHKYVEQPGLKVVFEDDSTCTTKVYGSIKRNGIFDEKRGTIFNSNKEVVIIFLRVRDVYVLDITSSIQESCFFAKASENLNWLWHRRLAHLKFKTINKLAKQNLVIGLSSLVYSKDKPCSSCKKGKHHRASFKTKQTSSIKKCLHLLHIDLFGPVTPRSINHEKYTLVIVDEYSRYTWVYFLKKKSQAPKTIMSFIKRVENQNDIKVKQLRTDNGTEFRNSILINFCDEKGISQNFSSPYTPEQNGVVERKNRTLIEAARTMLSGSVFSKQYWTEAVATTCYTQNRSTIVKRHLKTPYEFFRKRIPNINFLHVFGCPVYIHNHKDHLGKFDEKADDDESLDAIKFSKPLVDNIKIAENKRYPPDEYLHPYGPSQRYRTNNNDMSFIEPHECPELVVLETEVSSKQNG